MAVLAEFLKHLGLTDMPITTGSSFSPSAFTKNAYVSRCYAFFTPVHRLPLAPRIFSGRPRQKHPVSSMFQTSRAFHPVVISLARSFQLSIVSLLTSPASPATVLLHMLYFCLNFSSQPLDNDGSINCSCFPTLGVFVHEMLAQKIAS